MVGPVADTSGNIGGGGGGRGRNFQHICLWCRFKICESFKYNALTSSSFENTNSSFENTNSRFENTNSSFENTNLSFLHFYRSPLGRTVFQGSDLHRKFLFLNFAARKRDIFFRPSHL